MSYIFDFFNNKRILLTGHTGFKGSWLSEILLLAGAQVIGYSLNPPTNPNLFSMLNLPSRMTSIIGDIRDIKLLKTVFDKFRPQIVIHLAAQPIVLESYKNQLYTYETNVLGTVNILECIRTCNSVMSFLNVTTDKVYENNDLENHPFKEDEKLDGFDPYSNSKSCSELITHCYKKSFFDKASSPAISTARAGNVIGGGDFSPHRIMVDAVNAALKGSDFIVRNKYSTRPYQFVLEPLFIYLLICAKQFENKEFSGFYNIGPDACDAVSTGELASLFCKKWGNKMKWIDKSDPAAPHESKYLMLDNSLIKEKFGWKPIMHIDEAVDEIIEWAKAYQRHESIQEVVDKQILYFDQRFGK